MPAPTGATTTTVANLFEDQYNDEKVGILVNTADPLNRLLEQDAVTQTEGKQFIYFHTTALGDADRDFSENDDLAQPGNTTDVQAKYNMTLYNFTVGCSGDAITTEGAAVNILRHQINTRMAAMRLYFEKSPFMRSTGELAAIYSTPTSATSIVVDNDLLVDVGMKVDVVIGTTGVQSAGVTGATITAKTSSTTNATATLTLDTPLAAYASVDTTYIVVRSGGWNKSPFSLRDIIDSGNPPGGNLGQLDRSTYDLWQAHELDVENKMLNALHLALGCQKAEDRSGMPPNRIVLNPHPWHDLMKNATNDRRISNDTKNIQLYGTSLMFMDIPVYKYRFCPYDQGFIWNSEVIKNVHATGWPRGGAWVRPLDENGNPTGGPLQQVPGKWWHTAAYVVKRQRVCTMPNACVLLKNIGWSRSGMAA